MKKTTNQKTKDDISRLLSMVEKFSHYELVCILNLHMSAINARLESIRGSRAYTYKTIRKRVSEWIAKLTPHIEDKSNIPKSKIKYKENMLRFAHSRETKDILQKLEDELGCTYNSAFMAMRRLKLSTYGELYDFYMARKKVIDKAVDMLVLFSDEELIVMLNIPPSVYTRKYTTLSSPNAFRYDLTYNRAIEWIKIITPYMDDTQ